MRISFFSFLGFLLTLGLASPALSTGPVLAPTISPDVVITDPRPGEALQGVVLVEGRVRGEDFSSAELTFTYASGAPRNWFFIGEVDLEDEESSQYDFRFEWDTTQVTDGDYDLRVKAIYEGGQEVEATVSDLRIRNYSPVETQTPRPLGTTSPTPETPEAAQQTSIPTPTPLPPNPVSLERRDITAALGKGLAVVGGAFACYGLYVLIRKMTR
ncbi:MAG: hypothetical protein R6U57_13770 [Anaerolineales bacterium]